MDIVTLSSVLSPKKATQSCHGNRLLVKRKEETYLNRYMNDKQRDGWSVFIVTLRRVAASWRFLGFARLTSINLIWALCARLEKSPADWQHCAAYLEDSALAHISGPECSRRVQSAPGANWDMVDVI